MGAAPAPGASSPDLVRFRVDPGSRLLTWSDAGRVAELLATGASAVLPTDTGYMLSVPALDAAAVEDLFATKQRDRSAPVHMACSSPAMAERYGRFDGPARRALHRLLPGPVTLVVPAREGFDVSLAMLEGTVGIRMPACPASLQVVAELDMPVTATSLNPSGRQPIDDPTDDALRELAWSTATVAVVEDPAARLHDRPSTLLRMVGDELTVLRPGPVTEADARARLG